MSIKMTCPGCDSHTSSVAQAFSEGQPCPYCGLSAEAATEVQTARRRNADAELTAKYEEAVKRADRAEREAVLLRRHLQQIENAVKNKPEPSPW